MAAASSIASPRWDGGVAFVHGRGLVYRQSPLGRRSGFCPWPRPRLSPVPSGTAEGLLSMAAASSIASLPCQREGDRRQAVEGFFGEARRLCLIV